MDVQQELKNLKHVGLLIESIENELKKDKEQLSSFPSILAEVERDGMERIKELKQQRQETIELINKLENQTQRDILMERYLHGKKWDEIALKLSYTKSNLFRIHREAVGILVTLRK